MKEIQSQEMKKSHKYSIDTKNGMVRILIDGLLFFDYEQLAYKGRWFYKDFTNLYGLRIYLEGSKPMEIHFKSKDTWIAINKLMLDNL